MCARYTLRVFDQALAEVFDAAAVPEWRPRYNIAPSQNVPAVRVLQGGGPREVHLLRWGLIPYWSKDPRIGNRLINARSESADRKPSFRAAFQRRRCILPADGFYEWKATGRHKQPYYIHRCDNQPFAFAGLWERWQARPLGNDGVDPDHPQMIESCTLLTTEPNELLRPLHDRMPVIVEPAEYDRWLDPLVDHRRDPRGILRPASMDGWIAEPVSTYVNKPAHDDPRCVVPDSLSPED